MILSSLIAMISQNCSSALHQGDYGVVGRVVVCDYVLVCDMASIRGCAKKYSENCFHVGIIAVKISCTGPAITVLPFPFSGHLRALASQT